MRSDALAAVDAADNAQQFQARPLQRRFVKPSMGFPVWPSSLRFLDADHSILVSVLIAELLVWICRNSYWKKTMDLVYLAAFGLFFALMIGLAAGCSRLGGAK
jgi:ABC-type proline/glycine betaine transport system permease subunit